MCKVCVFFFLSTYVLCLRENKDLSYFDRYWPSQWPQVCLPHTRPEQGKKTRRRLLSYQMMTYKKKGRNERSFFLLPLPRKVQSGHSHSGRRRTVLSGSVCLSTHEGHCWGLSLIWPPSTRKTFDGKLESPPGGGGGKKKRKKRESEMGFGLGKWNRVR